MSPTWLFPSEWRCTSTLMLMSVYRNPWCSLAWGPWCLLLKNWKNKHMMLSNFWFLWCLLFWVLSFKIPM
jgi:hypothetical protein